MTQDAAPGHDLSVARRNLLFAIAGIALAIKLLLAARTYGTNDVYSFERFGVWGRYLGAELYKVAPDMNHPPSMLHVLSFFEWLAEHTPIPFQFWLRLPGILADTGSLALILRMLGDRLRDARVFAALLVIAAAPYQMLISGFHGNTDPVLISLVVAAVFLAGYRDRPVAAGIAFGVALCVKVAPVIAAPAILLYLSDFRRRAQFAGAALAVVLVGWFPYVYRAPSDVLHQVLGYKSSYGLWGLSWILQTVAESHSAFALLNSAFEKLCSPIALVAAVAAPALMSRMKDRPSLYTQLGVVYFLFFSLTGGFAVQYLAWLTPWLAAIDVVPAAFFALASFAFLLVVYNYWALGFPWYLGIAYPWGPHQYFQIVCWCSVVLALISLRFSRRIPISRITMTIGLVATVLLLGVPARNHILSDTRLIRPVYNYDVVLFTRSLELQNLVGVLDRDGRRTDAAAVMRKSQELSIAANSEFEELAAREPRRREIGTPEDYVEASLNDYNQGDFFQCVKDAGEANRLRQGMPAALNNLSLCSAQLGDWDTAISTAREGLRIAPDWEVLRQNLNYSLHGAETAKHK